MRRRFEFGLLALILLLASYLRLANLSDNPGWYSDEATHINIAHHLLDGRVAYFAVRDSTLLFARPPLFHVLLAGVFALFGESITTLRTLTGLLGVLSVGLLYAVTRRAGAGAITALVAALLYCIYPAGALYNRFGFSYNLLTPLVLLCVLGVCGYHQTRQRGWLVLAALSVGLGITADLMMLMFIPALLLMIGRHWRDLLTSILLVILPAGIYALWMLLTAPEAFLFDLRFTFSRLSTLTLPGQIGNIALNYTTLLSQDVWMPAGMVGLFLLRPARLRYTTLMLFWLPFLLMARTVALYSLSFYYLIPLLPLVALGAAGLIVRGVPYLDAVAWRGLQILVMGWGLRGLPRRMVLTGGRGLVLVLVVGSPLLTATYLNISHAQTRWPTAIDSFLINPQDARQAADFINALTAEQDVIIASPAFGWQLTGQVADFQMSAAYAGEDTPHLPGSLPHERWVFPADYTKARFVVVDNLWRSWGAVHIPYVAAMLRDVEDNWQLVFEVGALQVYERTNR